MAQPSMEPFTPKDAAQDPMRPTLGNVAPAPLKNIFGSVTPTCCPTCLGCGRSYSSCLEHLFLQAQHECHFLQETLLDPHLGQVPLWAVPPIPPGFSHPGPAHSGPHCPGSGLCPSLDSETCRCRAEVVTVTTGSPALSSTRPCSSPYIWNQ